MDLRCTKTGVGRHGTGAGTLVYADRLCLVGEVNAVVDFIPCGGSDSNVKQRSPHPAHVVQRLMA